MGNASEHSGITDVSDERIVVLSPFFLLEHEVDVAALRAGPLDETQAGAWSGQLVGVNASDWCTFTLAKGPHESLPANCISWQGAREYCQGHGADLPTEAQIEYASGALESSFYVWNQDVPVCSSAVYGLGAIFDPSSADGSCMPSAASHPSPQDAIGYPLATDRADAGLDTLALPGGNVTDLAGNLGEWALDWIQTETEPCWSAAKVYVDPVCTTQGTLIPGERSVRGASFVSNAGELPAARRDAIDPTTITPVIGFRCARPGD